jgi:hypothetical protein
MAPLPPQRQLNTQTTTTSNFTRMTHYQQPPSYEMAHSGGGGYFVPFQPMLPASMPTPCSTIFSQHTHNQAGANENINIFKKPSSRQSKPSRHTVPDIPNFKPADDRQEPVILAKCFSCQSYNSETYTMATLFKNKIFVGSLTQFVRIISLCFTFPLVFIFNPSINISHILLFINFICVLFRMSFLFQTS